MSFDPSLPQPFKENWRQAYRYENSDIPRLSTYQAPNGNPVSFVHGDTDFSGGLSVDTAEYPSFGLWSNTPLNELPQKITINGFIRGDEYIKSRNALVEAFRIVTSDDTPGFLELPLWGRFPVVVINWNVKEFTNQNGQCAISITFTRAGVTIREREQNKEEAKTENAAQRVSGTAIESFNKSLSSGADDGMITNGFTKFKERLIAITGRIQGSQNILNKITNSAVEITNLLAQGIRSPKDLALATFAAFSSIIAGVFEIKNSIADIASLLTVKDNMKNILLQFLSESNFSFENTPITIKEAQTKTAMENLYKTACFCAAGELLVKLENNTYEQTQGYWKLLQNLENSLDKNDPDVFRVIEELRLSVSKELSEKNLSNELIKNLNLPVPVIFLALLLGCSEDKLRQLNTISDSFLIKGNVIYV